MALNKKITLQSEETGEILRIKSFRWDADSHEASAGVRLYKNISSKVPVRAIFAKVRISGEVFDKYHAASLVNGSNQLEQLYLAAKAGHVVCDEGKDVLVDAKDV